MKRNVFHALFRFVAGFPRHFAGASLKPAAHAGKAGQERTFSPAFRWGLIEAVRRGRIQIADDPVFPGISLGPH